MGTMSHMLDGLDDQDFTEKESKESCGLKHCPHCGKFAAKVIEDYENSFIVECQFCRATSRRMYSPEAAEKEWNKRTVPEWR